MCTVKIAYKENVLDVFEHIKEIRYVEDHTLVTVQAENLTTHIFPIGCPLWLLADNHLFCVGCEQARYIEIEAEM